MCMLTGFISMVVFKFVGPNLPAIGPYLEALSPLPPSFALAIIVGIVGSNLNKKKPNFLKV